jgi:hypothetical protein
VFCALHYNLYSITFLSHCCRNWTANIRRISGIATLKFFFFVYFQ